jgi:hypothetical protein
MAADPFNSLTGYTVGIPAIQVVNNQGVVVGNVNANYVITGSLFTDNLRYSNGQRYVPGLNTQLVFNSSNAFGASPNLTFNSTTNFLSVTNLSVPGTTNLGDASQVSILGGENGYVLQTDGMGTLTWTAQTGGGGGNGAPGGSNTQVQFNSEGSFAGDPGFTYNNITNILSVGTVNSNFVGNLTGVASNAVVANTVSASAQPNITSVGVLTSLGVSGQVQALRFQGSGANLTNIPAANIVGSIPLAINVSGNDQPNITSLGTLTTLTVAGNTLSANINASNRMTAGNLFVTGNASLSGNFSMNTGRLIANGNINFTNAVSVNLGDVSRLQISGGFADQVLTTDGTGNLSWTDGGGGGGNGSPGGSNTAVQFNYNGVFQGSPYFTFNNVSNTVQVGGNLIANSFQMGSGVYQWSSSRVYFATTASTGAGQLLFSIPVSQVSGVEFEIIATDAVGGSRQFAKISSLYYSGTVEFNEYASLFVNGGVGNFDVAFNPGTIIDPPSLDLTVTPSTAHSTVYKMLITIYAP